MTVSGGPALYAGALATPSAIQTAPTASGTSMVAQTPRFPQGDATGLLSTRINYATRMQVTYTTAAGWLAPVADVTRNVPAAAIS